MRITTLALSIATLAGTAAAQTTGTETHTVPFDYNPAFGTTLLDLTGFDTQNGTRRLDAMTMNFNHNFDLTMTLESTGPTAIEAGDFEIQYFYVSLFQFGVANTGGGGDEGEGEGPGGLPRGLPGGGGEGPGGGGEGPGGGGEGGGEGDNIPFFGPGAFESGILSPALGAYDGVPGAPGPDFFSQDIDDSYDNSWRFEPATDQAVLDTILDVDTLTTVYGGFGELFGGFINDPGWPEPGGFFPEYPNDAAIWVNTNDFRHFGAIDVTYEFTVIPAPSAGALLALGALGAVRRRR